jgi:hypothetical protein
MDTHPDLVALIEGRLEQPEQKTAKQHLAVCPACKKDYQSIKEAVMQLQNIADLTKRAYPDNQAMIDALDERIGTPSAASQGQIEYLDVDSAVDALPPKLAKALAASRKSMAPRSRLMRAIESLTGKKGGVAQDLADKIMGGAGLQAGAPAMREDSTKEDGEEPQAEEQENQDKE